MKLKKYKHNSNCTLIFDRVITDFEKTTLANQRRMNADPFESFLMDMGYRVRDMSDNDNDDNGDDNNNDEDSGRPMQCAPS